MNSKTTKLFIEYKKNYKGRADWRKIFVENEKVIGKEKGGKSGVPWDDIREWYKRMARKKSYSNND